MPDDPRSLRARLEPLPLSHHAGSIALVVLGIALLAGAVVAAVSLGREEGLGTALALAIPGIAALVPGVLLLGRRGRQRIDLEADARGLNFTRPGRERERLAYEDLEAIEVDEKERLSNGVRAGFTRHLRLLTPAGTLSLAHFSRVDTPDPAAAALDAIVAGATDAFAEKLRRGLEIPGKGFVLSHAGVRVARGGVLVPLEEIGAAEVFERKVSLWRRGEQECFFTVAKGSPNARILLGLLGRALASRPAEPIASDQLGRALFRKRASATAAWLLGLVGLATAFAGVALLVDGAAAAGNGVAAAVALAIGAVLAGIGWRLWRMRLTCHETGVHKRGFLGDRTLFFRDIATLTSTITRMYHNGMYTGTSLSLKLVPAGAGKPLRFSTTTRGGDEDLDALRDHIAAAVADRLHQQVRAGAEVAWGKSARLSRDAVLGFAPKLIGKGAAVRVPLGPEVRYLIKDGTFSLFAPGSDKAALQMGCAEDNFFPGFILMARLASEAKPGARAES